MGGAGRGVTTTSSARRSTRSRPSSRDSVLAAHPRTNFKTGKIEALAAGVRDKPETAIVLGPVTFEQQPNLVGHRTDIEQLGVVVEAEPLRLQRGPQEHPVSGRTVAVSRRPVRTRSPRQRGRCQGSLCPRSRCPCHSCRTCRRAPARRRDDCLLRVPDHATSSASANTTLPRRPGSRLRANASRAEVSGYTSTGGGRSSPVSARLVIDWS
jgi:hypothetical protein